MLPVLLALAASAMPVPPGEQPVDPYAQSDANAGAMRFQGQSMWHAFHEQAGVQRIVDGFVDRDIADPVIGEIFKGQDIVRLRRTLKEQFCYILNGGCAYSGRTMKEAHKNLGIQIKDMNVLVVNLQKAMAAEGVPFFAQNRFLAKLAPMKKDVVVR
ncbi:group 1 truncated hemoglobin [Sphingomonas sp. CGMCC 1.13654]|uniref:Group 1 truncated hemoglobin n=1 Tax=Sphingomonas chungangi TaxID=2683589 RepID=A0A838L6J7_9SPHN|nr:group 1 truncated hemoglobin [Sphingomonas chungangi]MBA2934099.1 group 1 truncated hemoglobin [Sphingomonas chungangi]MVW57140.1 group 1 truncated hemoglobin [Sphingomonas chungangi]